MGIVAVKIKIMPLSPDSNLDKIKESAKKIIDDNDGKNCQFNEEPIAFGLKAVIVFFAWPEEKPFEEIENQFKEIENVNSVNLLDIRRAIG